MSFEFLNIYTTSIILCVFLFWNFKKIKNSLKENESLIDMNSRIHFFDFIKGIAIFGVVLMHVAYFFMDFNKYGNISILSDFIFKIFRFAVPFFIISSGFLLNIENFDFKNIKNFYTRKIFRIFIPYFIFCLFIFIFKNNDFIFIDFIKQFVFGNISIPYYFIIVLFQLYLIHPFILLLFKKVNNFLILFISFIISFASIFFYNTDQFPIFIPYIFYFVFGIFIKKYIIKTNIIWVLKNINFFNFSYFLIILYFIFGIIGLKDVYSNFQFTYSIVLFLLLFSLKNIIEKTKIFNIFVFLGKYSIWIFLSHFFILEIIFNLILK